MKRVFVSLLLTLSLVACSGVTAQKPDEIVFQLRTGQNVALRGAVEYRRLTPCAVPAKQPCSDKAVVAQLQRADKVADEALGAAETAVRSPGFGANVIDSAVVAAKAALAAFQAIVATFGSK